MRSIVSLGIILLFASTTALGALAVSPQDQIVALDIGQGDSFLFQHGTQQVVIDGGQGQKILQRLSEELPSFDRQIEIMIVTHPQRDHMEGLLYVLQHYNVGLVLLPELPYDTTLQHTWLQQLVDLKQPYGFAWQGDHLSLGDMQIDILSPVDNEEWRQSALKEANNASIVTRITFGNIRYIGLGDGETSLEKFVIDHNPGHRLEAEVLKAGHHGSKTSTGEDLLEAVKPSTVLISVGKDNAYGHPHKDVLGRLDDWQLPVFRTDQNGSIHLRRFNNSWSLVCGNSSLPWELKSCIKSTY